MSIFTNSRKYLSPCHKQKKKEELFLLKKEELLYTGSITNSLSTTKTGIYSLPMKTNIYFDITLSIQFSAAQLGAFLLEKLLMPSKI